MKRILFIICTLLLVSSLTVYAQESEARALVHQAKNFLDKKDYVKAKAKAEAALDKSPSNSEAKQIKMTCDNWFRQKKAEEQKKIDEQKEKERRRKEEAERKRLEAEQRERDAYQTACNSGSESEMRSFISQYPKYRTEIENRIEDLKLWNKAKETATVGAYNQYLNNSRHKYYSDEARREIAFIKNKDKREFESACVTNTEESYQRYLRNFPDGNFRADVQERILEIQSWNNARGLNTKTAYQDYLSKSTIKSHLKEANDAIQNIESEEEWVRIKDSNYRSDFERFVNNYSASVHRNEAEWHINLLKGEELYMPGPDPQAYDELALSFLKAANDYRRLTGEPAEHLEQLLEKKKYKEIMRSNYESEVQSYLNSIKPENPYYIHVSDHLAKLKADNLTNKTYNLKDYRDQAMTFAISPDAKQYVKDSYKSAKKRKNIQRKYSSNTRSHSSFNLGEWLGEHAQIGLDTSLDYALRSKTDKEVEDPGVNQLGIGLMGRFGRSTDVLNVFLGVRYWIISTPESFEDGIDDQKYETDENEYKGYLAFPLKIRCNVIRTDGHGSFFIGGGAEFGLCMNKMLDTSPFDKNFFSLSPQIGWTNRHFEVSAFYKSYLQGPFKKEWVDNFKTYLDRKSVVGINVGYYF